MSERWTDETSSGPNGRREPGSEGAGEGTPAEAGDEAFSLRGGLRFLVIVAVVVLGLSVLCWLVGGPTPQ